MNISNIKKGDTVELIAERRCVVVLYTGVACSDYKADAGSPGVSLKMPNGTLVYLTESGGELRLTSWRACSLIDVAKHGYFV